MLVYIISMISWNSIRKSRSHSSAPTFSKTRKKLKISMKKIGYEGINPLGRTVDFLGAFKTMSY